MLEDKVIIVTGAASGLGEATAHVVAKHGATVVLNDLVADDAQAVAESIRTEGGDVTTHTGDISDFEYVESLVKDTVDEFGRVDGVVNYAGILRDSMSFNMSPDDWQSIIDVHLTGHFNLVRNVADHWRTRYKEQGGFEHKRSFIAVSSGAARGNPGQLNYSAAKAGILGLTRTAARELYQYDICVNVMMPTALTPLVRQDLPDELIEQLPEDELTSENVAVLPLALFSDEVDDITGWTFAIGGDRVYSVTDPEFLHTAIMKGGWTGEDLADELGELLNDHPHAKTEMSGMISKLL